MFTPHQETTSDGRGIKRKYDDLKKENQSGTLPLPAFKQPKPSSSKLSDKDDKKSADAKRKQINIERAKRHREKRKQEIAALEADFKRLEQENPDLETKIANLEAENDKLKKQYAERFGKVSDTLTSSTASPSSSLMEVQPQNLSNGYGSFWADETKSTNLCVNNPILKKIYDKYKRIIVRSHKSSLSGQPSQGEQITTPDALRLKRDRQNARSHKSKANRQNAMEKFERDYESLVYRNADLKTKVTSLQANNDNLKKQLEVAQGTVSDTSIASSSSSSSSMGVQTQAARPAKIIPCGIFAGMKLSQIPFMPIKSKSGTPNAKTSTELKEFHAEPQQQSLHTINNSK
jgi:predicted  nucleic acid-binding Zn-ribbon protein